MRRLSWGLTLLMNWQRSFPSWKCKWKGNEGSKIWPVTSEIQVKSSVSFDQTENTMFSVLLFVLLFTTLMKISVEPQQILNSHDDNVQEYDEFVTIKRRQKQTLHFTLTWNDKHYAFLRKGLFLFSFWLLIQSQCREPICWGTLGGIWEDH